MTGAPPKQPGTHWQPPLRTGGRLGHVAYLLTALALVVTWTSAWTAPMWSFVPTPITLGLHFLPWISAGLVALIFTLWTLAPDHRAGVPLTTVAVLAPLAHWGPTWAAADTEHGAEALTVLTWNVRRLWGGDAAGDPTQCVASLVAEQSTDLLFLQELTADDTTTLESAAQLRCVHSPYSASDVAGTAICTHRDSAWRLTAYDARQFSPSDDWRYLDVELATDHQTVRAVGVHLTPHRILHDPSGAFNAVQQRGAATTATQGRQAQALIDRLDESPLPVVLAGDFNSAPDAPLHAHLRRHLSDSWLTGAMGFGSTVSLAGWLPLRIDYVYAGRGLIASNTFVPATGCSDHLPVVATLAWSDPNHD